MALLDNATNLYGTLKPEIRARLMAFMDNPTQETWQDVSGIIINAKSMRRSTVWQAVIAMDPTFPRGKFAGAPWPQIPDPMLVARAIKAALQP